MAATTVYFARNCAFFLERTVVRELSDEDMAKRGMTPESMQALMSLTQEPKVSVTTTSAIYRQEEMLDLLGSALEAQEGDPGPQAASHFGFGGVWVGSGVNGCPQKISVVRLDEGFCLTHHKPVDTKAIERIATVEGDEWKGKKPPTWIAGFLQLAGGHLMKGPVEVHAFREIAEVVRYVREAAISVTVA